MADAPPSRSGWLDLLTGLVVAGVAVVVLTLAAPIYRPQKIHVAPHLNDQAGYITTARWLADTGELRSHLIYPAYVENERFRLYMPGHYVALAAAYKLFGNGPIVWRLPNLVGYVLAAVGVFAIGRMLHDRATGLAASILFMAFPGNVTWAWTAMSEMTLVAACVLSFVVFLALPARWRFAFVPLLLVGPFLFRETAALLVLPMTLLAARDAALGRWRGGAIAALGSVLVLAGVNRWQIAAGKEPTPLTWVTEGKFNYAKISAETTETPALSDWVAGLVRNFGNNVDEWLGHFEGKSAEPWLTSLVLLGMVLAFVAGGWRMRDPFATGVGLLGLAAALLVVFLYDVFGYRALRITLFTLPFACVVAGHLLVRGAAGLGRRLPARVPRGVALAVAWLALSLVAFGGGRRGMRRMSREMSGGMIPAAGRELEKLGPDDRKLLVCPAHIGLDYVLRRYPVRWSFPPEDEATLRKICELHDVGFLMLPKDDVGVDNIFTPQVVLGELGFQLDKRVFVVSPRWKEEYGELRREYVILRRP